MKKTVVILLFISFIISGCVSSICNYSQIDSKSLEKMHQFNSDFVDKLKDKKLKKFPLVVTTIVNIDKIDSTPKSSTFGRVAAEDIKKELVNKGFEVKELKLRKSIFIKQNEGEFILSRNIKKIATKQNIHALITGTYTVAYNKLYVNIEVVNPKNEKILYSYSYTLPLDNNLRELLNIPLIRPIYCQ